MKKRNIVLFLSISLLFGCTSTSSSSTSTSSSSTSTSSSSSSTSQPAIFPLAQLQGNILFKGSYSIAYEGEDHVYHNELTTGFTSDTFYSLELAEDGTRYDATIVNKADGLYLAALNDQNTVVYQKVTDFTWESFSNPFVSLTLDHFVAKENNVFALEHENIDAIATVITGWEEAIASFEVKLAGNKIEEIVITTEDISQDFGGFIETYQAIYTLALEKVGSDVDLTLKPYPTLDYHATITSALTKINTASFRLTHLDEQPNEADIEYNYYFTEEAIYCDAYFADSETVPSGIVALSDGLYRFTAVDNAVVKGESVSGKIQDYRPLFTGFAPELLVRVDANTYQAQGSFAPDLAYYFAEDGDQMQLAASATSFTITLNDAGDLATASFDYNIMGYIIGKVTMTYSDIGSTMIPLDFSGLDSDVPPEEGFLPVEYLGTWRGKNAMGEKEEYTVVIEDEIVLINGEEALLMDFDPEVGIIIEYKGLEFTLFYDPYQGGNMTFMSSDFSIIANLSKVEDPIDPPSGLEVPKIFIGEWQGKNMMGNKEDYSVSITATTIAINGIAASIDEVLVTGEVLVTWEGASFTFLYEAAYETPFLSFSNDNYTVMVKLYKA